MPSEVESKSLFKSKTFWFNVLTAVGTLLASPVALALIPASALVYVPVVQGLVNVGLRAITDQPVHVGKP